MTEKVVKIRKSDFENSVEDLIEFNKEDPIQSFVIAFTFIDEDGKQIAFSHSQNAELIELVGLASFLQNYLLNESAQMAQEFLH